jgi:acyl-CoA synthetase (AMP-forming)/AMP-acid ligase II
MRVARLLESFKTRGAADCLVWQGRYFTYAEVHSACADWSLHLDERGVSAGAVVGIKAGFSAPAVSLFFALLARGCTAALIPPSAKDETVYLTDGQIEGLFRFEDSGDWTWEPQDRRADHPLIAQLRTAGEGGFMIFSSGSTGRPKAVLHSAERFLKKYDAPGKPLRTLAFLLFDHIAGIDTLFYTLSAGGTLILPDRRDPLTVCRAIQDHRVEVLPASPAFLNLLCMSGDFRDFDLGSLKIITYGSEPMNQGTLDQICEIFPNARIVQKYGTSEFGAPRAQSRGNDSLWLRLKDDELGVQIRDGMLWVRADTAMLGYLNAPQPFDDEGWYCTGDIVERDGEWIRILGRQSDVIIVGGEKVYPQEVEAVIADLDWVADVAVKGEPHPMLGQIVTARIYPARVLDGVDVRLEVRRHCRARLASYKVPAKVEVAEHSLTSDRQKKDRSGADSR